jgi:hypothetical protein
MEGPSSFSDINCCRYFASMVAESQFYEIMLPRMTEAFISLSGNFASRFSHVAKSE